MKTVAEVLNFIEKSGHKISRAQFYRHRLEGAISGPPYDEKALLKYATEFLKEKKDRRRIVSSQAAELKRVQLEKMKATAGYARLRTEKLRGDLISKKEIEMIYSQACLRMLTILQNLGFKSAEDICEFFEGNPKKIDDFRSVWPEYCRDFMSEFVAVWREQGIIKLPNISMIKIMDWYEELAATHGGRDIEDG